mmetsp:Transcript_11628/g.48374  ORF Transcript_11628/g.48374 Transcript_11628/m.48374 type:complete len:159 (-) Transcript_11628:1005-1481(-)
MRFEPSRTGTEKVIPVHRLVLMLQFASCFVGILSDILKSRIHVVHMIQIESGVIERLVLSFLGYPENLVVLEHGIACLVNLANAEPAVQRIKDINVIDSVGRALNDYPKHLEIQSQGQALISKINIFSKPEQEENYVAERGTVVHGFHRGFFTRKRTG